MNDQVDYDSMGEIFDKLDVDHDGRISQKEFCD